MYSFPILHTLPTFPLDPDGTAIDAVLRTEPNNGMEHARQLTPRQRRQWGIAYPALRLVDRNTLGLFEGSTLVGGSRLFNWTHPVSGEIVTVRLTAPIDYRYIAPNIWAVSLELQEA